MTQTSLVTTGKTDTFTSPTILPEYVGAYNTQPATAESKSQNKVGHSSLRTKLILDYLVAGFFVTLGAPLLALIAILIKTSSRGPVFYIQKRVGQDGKTFNFIKFRTMKHNNDDSVHREFSRNFIRGANDRCENGENADVQASDVQASDVQASNVQACNDHATNGQGNHNGAKTNGHPRRRNGGRVANSDPIYKLTRDPRVTPIGALLRRTSLDELPQLFNILKGEMSMVGPRPPVVYELDHYEEWHKKRLAAKPGITGLWQVSGRSSVPFDEMVLLDLYYIENRSTAMDLRIMAKTLPVMLKGEGAY